MARRPTPRILVIALALVMATASLAGCVRIDFVIEQTDAPQVTLEGSAEDTYDLSHNAELAEGTAGAEVVLELVNRVRTQEDLEPLELHEQLNEAAQAQAEHQADIQAMTHDGLGGLGERVSATDYQWRMVAENVATLVYPSHDRMGEFARPLRQHRQPGSHRDGLRNDDRQ